MKKTEKTPTFVERFVAIVNGDNPEALAQKVFRQVQSALNTQIAIMTGDLVTKEEELEIAKERLQKAILNNGRSLESHDRTSYVRNLVSAHNSVKEAEESLDTHIETLKFLRNQLSTLEAEASL